MSAPGRVIRRPQSTLIVYGSPPTVVYKLSQRDVPRIEQAADTALDFLAQPALQAAVERLGVPLLALDAEDQAALAPLGYAPPAAPARRPLANPRGRPARPAANLRERPAFPLFLPVGQAGPIWLRPPTRFPRPGCGWAWWPQ